MIIEYSNGQWLEDPTDDQVKDAVQELDGMDKKYVKLAHNAQSYLKVVCDRAREIHLLLVHDGTQWLQEEAATREIVQRIALAYVYGVEEWWKPLTFQKVVETDRVEIPTPRQESKRSKARPSGLQNRGTGRKFAFARIVFIPLLILTIVLIIMLNIDLGLLWNNSGVLVSILVLIGVSWLYLRRRRKLIEKVDESQNKNFPYEEVTPYEDITINRSL